MRGLSSGFVAMDIEKFCRDNLDLMVKKQKGNKPINFDYTDGIKDVFREILDTYFGGVE